MLRSKNRTRLQQRIRGANGSRVLEGGPAAMTTQQIIFTIFEILLIITVILGVKYEYKLIDFEIALKEKIKKFLEVIF
jgi:hypothetical protein